MFFVLLERRNNLPTSWAPSKDGTLWWPEPPIGATPGLKWHQKYLIDQNIDAINAHQQLLQSVSVEVTVITKWTLKVHHQTMLEVFVQICQINHSFKMSFHSNEATKNRKVIYRWLTDLYQYIGWNIWTNVFNGLHLVIFCYAIFLKSKVPCESKVAHRC